MGQEEAVELMLDLQEVPGLAQTATLRKGDFVALRGSHFHFQLS